MKPVECTKAFDELFFQEHDCDDGVVPGELRLAANSSLVLDEFLHSWMLFEQEYKHFALNLFSTAPHETRVEAPSRCVHVVRTPTNRQHGACAALKESHLADIQIFIGFLTICLTCWSLGRLLLPWGVDSTSQGHRGHVVLGGVPLFLCLQMGITNLLQFLKPITTVGHVEDCRGEVVGVDAMCWMHRGAAACAVELVEGRESDKFLRFFIAMVSLLRYYGVTPLIVFDGSRIDVKSGEDEKRRLRRETARGEALELLARKRNNMPVDHRELMSKCSQSISITPAMVDKVIAACRELGIRCLVAPFEADAQLAYLSRTNQIHSAISEDSDLLAYGCKRLLLKMDKDGKCDVIRLPFLQDENDRPELASRETQTTKQQELLRSLAGLNHERFVAMCVLGGCDYTNHVHINGMGIATACRLVSQLRSLKRVLDFLCRDKKWSSRFPMAKEEVIEGHLLAEKTFMEHKVFDPRTKRVVLIRAVDTQEKAEGTEIGSQDACARAIEIASGLIDPRTGGLRQTHLSPAECELIKECQERAFCGLEAQQLRVQAAACKAEALRKQTEERALKEAASQRLGGKTTERKEVKQKVVASAAAVIRMERNSEKSETEHEARRVGLVDLFSGFNAFSASVAPTCTSNSMSTASTDSKHLVRQLLSEMTPQGFHLSSTAISTDAPGDRPGSARTPDSPGCLGTTPYLSQDTMAAAAGTECAPSGQESSSALATCNLEQFAFKWDKTEGGSQSTRTRRRDIVTRTRFAHRTKLVSAAGQRCPPFSSLISSAETTESVKAISVTHPETSKGAAALSEPLQLHAKRKSVGFLRADDTEAASALLSVRSAQEQPKKHKLF
ncbi:hypothetical protein Esti_005772 [Eimeria stiedai]